MTIAFREYLRSGKGERLTLYENLVSIIIILCLTVSIMTPYAQAANSDVNPPYKAANQYGYAGLSAAYEPTVLLMLVKLDNYCINTISILSGIQRL